MPNLGEVITKKLEDHKKKTAEAEQSGQSLTKEQIELNKKKRKSILENLSESFKSDEVKK